MGIIVIIRFIEIFSKEFNFLSCQSPIISIFRVFLPTLEEYFGEAIEQSDPAAMIEDEYK